MSLQRFAVEFDASNTATDSVRVFNRDLVSRGVVSENDFEVSPSLRDAGINEQSRAMQTKSEYPLEARPIHPSSRAGVPTPATAPDVCGLGIYVAAGNVGLGLVAVNGGTRAGVIDRVQKRKHLTGLVSVTEHRESDHRPDGRVRVLAAVLPDAGRVSFDVARVVWWLIERWG